LELLCVVVLPLVLGIVLSYGLGIMTAILAAIVTGVKRRYFGDSAERLVGGSLSNATLNKRTSGLSAWSN
jgi:hypothetical protein